MVKQIPKCHIINFKTDEVLLNGHDPVDVIGYRQAICSDGLGVKPRWKRVNVEGKSEAEIRQVILEMVAFLSDYSLSPKAQPFAQQVENAIIGAKSNTEFRSSFASLLEQSAVSVVDSGSVDRECGTDPLMEINRPTIFVFGLLFPRQIFVDPWLEGSSDKGTHDLDPYCANEVRVSEDCKHMLWYSSYHHDDKPDPGEHWYSFHFKHILNTGTVLMQGLQDPGNDNGGGGRRP